MRWASTFMAVSSCTNRDQCSYFYPHMPIPLRRSVIYAFQRRFPEYIEWVRRNKTRVKLGCSQCQQYGFKCPCQQQHYPVATFAYQQGKAVLNRTPVRRRYVDSQKLHTINQKTFKLPTLLCLNNTDNDNRAQQKHYMHTFFKTHFDQKPYFENDAP